MDNWVLAIIVIVVMSGIIKLNNDCTDQGKRLARIGMTYECVK
jgi:hypothetical protein